MDERDQIEPTYDRTEQALPLPGMEVGPTNVPPLVQALRRTVRQLQAQDIVQEVDALDLAAMLLLARSAEMKLATGRGSTIANDVELLLRTKRELIGETEDSGLDERLRTFMSEWDKDPTAGEPPP